MIVYFAGVDRAPKDIRDAVSAGARHFMISYHYRNSHPSIIRLLRSLGAHIMLDSGAFSAWKIGAKINLDDYIQYINRNRIGKYVSLDVVGDPELSAFNLGRMEEFGLNPIPVFHMGADWHYMNQLAERYRYVAIGGTVGSPSSVRDRFFSELFDRYPDTYFHGLGLSAPDLMIKYPWLSVDSTTWLIGKKHFEEQTDTGRRKLAREISVSERVQRNVTYFVGLENRIRKERFA